MGYIEKYEKPYLIILLVILFISRILSVIMAAPIELSGDAIAYNQSAIDLLDGKGYMWAGWYSEVLPFYSLFVAFVYAVFGCNPLAVYLIQSVFDVCAAVFLFLIAKQELRDIKVGLLTIVLIIIYPTLYKSVQFLGSYNLFTMQMACVVFLFFKALRDKKLILFILTGLALGVASLTRNSAILLWIPMFVYTLFARKGKGMKTFFYLVALGGVMILTITPWVIRNYKVHGNLLITSTNGGYSLWLAGAKKSDWSYSDLPSKAKFSNYLQNYKKIPEIQANQMFFKKGLENIKNHPRDYIFTVITNFGRLYLNFPYSKIPSRTTIIFITLNLLILILAVSGFFVDWRKTLFIGFYIAYFTAVHMFFHIAWFWYNLQTVPFLLLLASIGITRNFLTPRIK